MEHVTTGSVRQGSLMVRSLRELQDERGARVPVDEAIGRWMQKLMAASTRKVILVFLVDGNGRVRGVHEVAFPCAGARLVREVFRAAIVFDAAQVVLVCCGSRSCHSFEACPETMRLLRSAAAVLGITTVVTTCPDRSHTRRRQPA